MLEGHRRNRRSKRFDRDLAVPAEEGFLHPSRNGPTVFLHGDCKNFSRMAHRAGWSFRRRFTT